MKTQNTTKKSIKKKSTKTYKSSTQTISEEEVPKQYRNFMFMLYEDTTSYDFEETMIYLKGNFRKWAYIKHEPESDEKKEHIHFLLRSDNPRRLENLSSQSGVPIQHIKPVRSLRAMGRYLTHIDNPEKKQYTIDDVVCSKNYEREYHSYFDDLLDEPEIINNIFLFIDNCNIHNYYELIRSLTQYVSINFYEPVYRRYRNEFLAYANSKIMSF